MAAFFNVLILVGAIQGFISCVLLWAKKTDNHLSNRLLGFIILFISMACLNLYLMQTGIRYRSEFFYAVAYCVPLIIVMPIGPLIYFYTKAVLELDFKIHRESYRHFYTAVIDLVPYCAGTVFLL